MSYRIRNGYTRVSGLFAFWRYDLFPYVLGGPVMAMNAKGHIQAESYGGNCFVPIKLVPKAEGRKLIAQIEELRKHQRAAEQKFRDEWRSKIEVLLPEAARLDDE